MTRETLDELAAEGITLEASGSGAEPVGGGQVVGVQTVHVWRQGMTSADLPQVYRDIVDVVDDAPGPVQAKQVVPRIGLPALQGDNYLGLLPDEARTITVPGPPRRLLRAGRGCRSIDAACPPSR
ncbi:hypothetical protein ACFWNG_06255 [Streptomyces sp. NPDC058391]|uniref:hypothetical protein n=1 Tax=Streptomyces sp. NPDC058391 TaxID=3346476 RepID=UPI003666DF8B